MRGQAILQLFILFAQYGFHVETVPLHKKTIRFLRKVDVIDITPETPGQNQISPQPIFKQGNALDYGDLDYHPNSEKPNQKQIYDYYPEYYDYYNSESSESLENDLSEEFLSSESGEIYNAIRGSYHQPKSWIGDLYNYFGSNSDEYSSTSYSDEDYDHYDGPPAGRYSSSSSSSSEEERPPYRVVPLSRIMDKLKQRFGSQFGNGYHSYQRPGYQVHSNYNQIPTPHASPTIHHSGRSMQASDGGAVETTTPSSESSTDPLEGIMEALSATDNSTDETTTVSSSDSESTTDILESVMASLDSTDTSSPDESTTTTETSSDSTTESSDSATTEETTTSETTTDEGESTTNESTTEETTSESSTDETTTEETTTEETTTEETTTEGDDETESAETEETTTVAAKGRSIKKGKDKKPEGRKAGTTTPDSLLEVFNILTATEEPTAKPKKGRTAAKKSGTTTPDSLLEVFNILTATEEPTTKPKKGRTAAKKSGTTTPDSLLEVFNILTATEEPTAKPKKGRTAAKKSGTTTPDSLLEVFDLLTATEDPSKTTTTAKPKKGRTAAQTSKKQTKEGERGR